MQPVASTPNPRAGLPNHVPGDLLTCIGIQSNPSKSPHSTAGDLVELPISRNWCVNLWMK
uniref:Uncharacterized protein n=1 Tax=Anguilla anguilla TaxID=7936 RepID=A0A0E9WJK3_ANGAN